MSGGAQTGLAHHLRLWLAWIAALAGLALPVYFAAAALGVKFGLWGWRTGLGALTVDFGPPLAMAVLALGVLALIAAILVRPRGRGALPALVGLIVPALILYQAGQMRAQAQSVPPIHDISTDLQDPPQFSEVLISLRDASGAENALDGGQTAGPQNRPVRELQREAYPDISTLSYSQPPKTVFEAAQAAAEAMGWTVQYSDAQAGRLDATAETFWFGFKDDVAIRVRPAQEGGALVDIRSVSRVGVSDLGANAARIRAFREALEARL